jgi:hypothetical protein
MKKIMLIAMVCIGCVTAPEDNKSDNLVRSSNTINNVDTNNVATSNVVDTKEVVVRDTILVGCEDIGAHIERTEHTMYNVPVDLMMSPGKCNTDLVVQSTYSYPKSLCEYKIKDGEYIIDIIEVEEIATNFTSCSVYSKGDIDPACETLYTANPVGYVSIEDAQSCML